MQNDITKALVMELSDMTYDNVNFGCKPFSFYYTSNLLFA